MFGFGMFSSPRGNPLNHTPKTHPTRNSKATHSKPMVKSPSILLQEGGHGAVFKESVNNTDVAIKKPHNPTSIHRWEGEVKLHAQLSHPNIVRFITYDLNIQTLTLEFIDGGDLLDTLKFHPLTWNNKNTILKGVMEAVHYLHTKRILHRDLKPDNVLIQWQNHQCTAKICDFGYAIQLSDDDNSIQDDTLGATIYLAPEVLKNGLYSEKSDIYAAAAMIGYALATKVPLFDTLSKIDLLFLKNNQAYLAYKLNHHRETGIQISEKLIEVITAANHPNPHNRPTATQLLNFPLFNEPKDTVEALVEPNIGSPERTFY